MPDFEQRKAYLRLTDEDARRLRELGAAVASRRTRLVDAFYQHLLSFPTTRALIPDERALERLRRSQEEYFSRLFDGTYDRQYAQNRKRVGVVHQRIGLEPQWYVGAYALYLQQMLPEIAEAAGGDWDRAQELLESLFKVVFLDLGIAIDTYREADTRRLLETKRHFEEVFRQATDGIVLVDTSGRITSMNPAAERIFGLRAGASARLPVVELVPLALRPACESAFASVLAGEDQALSRMGLTEGLRRDGTVFPMESSLASYRVNDAPAAMFFVRDITERQRAERALRRSEENFRALIERSPDAITVHRLGRFVYVNGATAAYLGYDDPAELVGRTVSEIVHPDDRTLMASRVRRMVETGELAPQVEERFLRKDGTTVVGEVQALPIRFDGADCIATIARDVTTRNQIRSRLLEMDRMIAVGTLAAGVGHEINNPLAYVIANQNFIARELSAVASQLRAAHAGAAAPEVRDGLGTALRRLEEAELALTEAREGADRVGKIVRDLKAFSRAEKETQAVAVQPALDFAVRVAWNEIRHRARLVKEYGETPLVQGSSSRLGQVFLNLLVNAAHSIQEGHADGNEIRVTTGTDARGRVLISVRDTGVGIPPEHLGRIFDPFFTTKPVGQGSGIGLAICQGIVRGVGGEILVESVPGKGSVFTVALPPAPPALEAAPIPAPPEAHVRGARILLIDDEPLVGMALQRLLQQDHTVTFEARADRALMRLENGEVFDVVLCDLAMPEISGAGLYAILQERSPALAARMIFLTGGAFTPEAGQFLERVPNLVLEKPIDERQLANAIRQVML